MDDDITTADLRPAEQAAWKVAIDRGLAITAADLRAMCDAYAFEWVLPEPVTGSGGVTVRKPGAGNQ